MVSISLHYGPIPASWGSKVSWFYEKNCWRIKLQERQQPSEHYRQLQKAGKALYEQGIRHFYFIGKWSSLQQWAFVIGCDLTDQELQFEWGPNDDGDVPLSVLHKVYSWIRTVVNAPPSEMNPQKYSQSVLEFLQSYDKDHELSVRVIEDDDLINQGFLGTHIVGKGSIHKPLVMEIDFMPHGADKEPVHYFLVGKGVTFDSGGYSIKPRMGMHFMKCDMAGSAMLCGGLAIAMISGLRKRTKLVICCAENMIGDNAAKPGDIIYYQNGVSVEITNTDSEGRLLLADGLLYAAKFNPKLIVDVATLTSAAITALGRDFNAVMGLDKQAVAFALESAESAANYYGRCHLKDGTRK